MKANVTEIVIKDTDGAQWRVSTEGEKIIKLSWSGPDDKNKIQSEIFISRDALIPIIRALSNVGKEV